MAENNQYRQVDVEFAGGWHSLRFNFNAFAALEKELGKPVSKLEFANMGLREYRALLWASLLHQNKKLDIDQVGDWLDEISREGQLPEIIKALGDAYLLGMPKPKEDKAPDPNEKAAGTGTPSNS